MAYIILLIGLILLFINIYLGFILCIVSLIFSIIKFKDKDFLNTVTLILSSIIIVICIIHFIISSFSKSVEHVEEVIDNSKNNNYVYYEQKLENLAKEYVINDQMINGMVYSGISYIQLYDIDKDNSNGCDGYVKYDYDENIYKAYIKCSDYQTDGYQEIFDK